ncbi:MAG TPA: hypothetical protein VEB64_08890 [Azospirillaceae bacterium]|nr:hypothetical protein [Azospirillaceae bacterium]
MDDEAKSLLGKLVELIERQNDRFDRLEERMDTGFATVTQRMDGLEGRMDGLEGRMGRLETRVETGFAEGDRRFDRLEAKVDANAEKMAEVVQSDRRRIDEVRGGLDVLGKRFDALVVPKAAAE